MGASRTLLLSTPQPFIVEAQGTPGFQSLDLSGANGNILVLEETSEPEVFNDVTAEYEYSITRTAHHPPPGIYGDGNPDFNLGIGTPSTGYNPAASTYYLYNMTTQDLTWGVYTNVQTDIIVNDLAFEITAIPKEPAADLQTLSTDFAILITLPEPESSDDPDFHIVVPTDYTPDLKDLEDMAKLEDEGVVVLPDTPLEYKDDDLIIYLDARIIMYKPTSLNEILDHEFKSY
jgi:hypothetical protein